MSTQEDRTTRRAMSVPDGDLSARLLAFLQDGAGCAPHPARVLPAADPALVGRLSGPAVARPAPGRQGPSQ